jgi:hypothetical protein
MAGTSRVNREVYARFCGRLVVKFHRPTRQHWGQSAGLYPAQVWIRETNESEPSDDAS